MSSSKVIIIAAGRGRRLGRQTEDMPKCMVRVAGQPILHWQLRAFAAAGLSDIVVVRGYLGDRIDGGRAALAFVDNPDWANNNILASLLCAADHLPDGFFFSYADIVYTPGVVARLAAHARVTDAAPVSLVIDRRWADAYQGRTLHPISEAELTLLDGPRVVRVGKGAVAPERAVGEFIGLAHFSAAGAAALRAAWDKALAAGGLDAPFGLSPTLRQAYLTDALNALADQGARLAPVFIDGQWREIDTLQDLAAAQGIVAGWDAHGSSLNSERNSATLATSKYDRREFIAMLSKTMQDAFSEQIRNEFASAYLYLSMALYFEGQSLPGFAKWMRVQFTEEQTHAMKMLDFVVDRGETVTLSAIEKPVSDFKSATDVFERTLAHERKVTSLIHNLYAQASKENDYASMEMLQWFIKEQVEEEKNASLILDQLKMVGDKGSSLVMLDHRIGKRGE